MRRSPHVLFFLALFLAKLCFGAPDGAKQLTVPSGTRLRVEVSRRTRLQKNQVIDGRLLDPVYSENRLLIPSGATLQGTVTDLHPATRTKRWDAKFHGDFTPLEVPVIQWTELDRSDGSQYPLLAESGDGAGSTLYFRKPGGDHPSLFRRAWSSMVGRKDSAVNSVTAPHKWDRLQRFFWSQMPYHPQYLDEGTQYEMALTADLHVSAQPTVAPVTLSQQQPLENLVSVHSRLRTDLNSATAKPGDPVEAVVTQPVLDAHNQLLIPQYSILRGKVLSATPSRSLGRNGLLRFSFNEVTWPSGFREDVDATPTAIESSSDTKMAIDDEGGVTRETNRSIVAPLVMGLLSAQAFGDSDGALGSPVVASNGFAIIGRLAAIGIGSRYVGGTIGAAGSARTVYIRFLAHGKETHFGNDTEIVLEMSPAHANRMSPVP